jgi:hypothetical protein
MKSKVWVLVLLACVPQLANAKGAVDDMAAVLRAQSFPVGRS